MSFKLFTDGGSRGNPGNCAIAYFLFENDQIIDFGGKYLDQATNNFAEYNALINGIKLAKKYTNELECYLDSELVVKQINGIYKVSSADIKPLHQKLRSEIVGLKKITFTHVPREQNKLADKLVNIILDTIEQNNA